MRVRPQRMCVGCRHPKDDPPRVSWSTARSNKRALTSLFLPDSRNRRIFVEPKGKKGSNWALLRCAVYLLCNGQIVKDVFERTRSRLRTPDEHPRSVYLEAIPKEVYLGEGGGCNFLFPAKHADKGLEREPHCYSVGPLSLE